MFNILVNTTLPIFSIILLGLILKRRNFIDAPFIKTANQLVYKVAIPVTIFREIGEASFRANFNLAAVFGTLAAMMMVVVVSILTSRLAKISHNRRGTFLHSSFHGNIAYMAFAVAFYSLGESHFASMAILSGFVILGQNLLAVWVLSVYGTLNTSGEGGGSLFKRVVSNPIIISVVLGIAFSLSGMSMPVTVRKGLDILSGMAFPTALLLIGASLSFGAFRVMKKELAGIGFFKLMALPLLGYLFMALFQVPQSLVLPGLILLAAPPATITYVMAVEMGGHPELAATSISVLTLLSAVSYSLILAAFAVG